MPVFTEQTWHLVGGEARVKMPGSWIPGKEMQELLKWLVNIM